MSAGYARPKSTVKVSRSASRAFDDRPSRKCVRPALRAAAVNARRTGTRVTTNTRSGVDGGEHSATLESMMAGSCLTASARAAFGQVYVQNAVTIPRRPPGKRGAHGARHFALLLRSSRSTP